MDANATNEIEEAVTRRQYHAPATGQPALPRAHARAARTLVVDAVEVGARLDEPAHHVRLPVRRRAVQRRVARL